MCGDLLKKGKYKKANSDFLAIVCLLFDVY